MNLLGRRKTDHIVSKIHNHSEVLNKLEEPIDSKNKVHIVFSPTTGKIIPLKEVDDAVFMQEMVGKGVGIFPEIPSIFSPVQGIVKYIPKTKHAIIIASDDGLEVLIHIGLDTVELNGQYFNMMVHKDQKVKVGDLLLHFNMQAISKLGYNLTIPVVITNSNDFSRIIPTKKKSVLVEDRLIDIFE